MNILLLGATGRVGQKLLEKLLHDGHHVSALVRSPLKLEINHSMLHIIEGNVLNRRDMEEAFSFLEYDAVISALNTDNNQTLSKCTPVIVELMNKYQLKRFIGIGTAGILNSRIHPQIYRFQSSESKRKSTTAAEDHLAAYMSLQQSALAWTLVCPTYLPDGGEKGNYRVEADKLPLNGKAITVGDTAAFTYRQLTDESYIHQRVGLAY